LQKRTKKLLIIWDAGFGSDNAHGPCLQAFFARFFAKKRCFLLYGLQKERAAL